jgi:hypothetical protein
VLVSVPVDLNEVKGDLVAGVAWDSDGAENPKWLIPELFDIPEGAVRCSLLFVEYEIPVVFSMPVNWPAACVILVRVVRVTVVVVVISSLSLASAICWFLVRWR